MDHSEARLVPYLIENQSLLTIKCQNANVSRETLRSDAIHAMAAARQRQQDFYGEIISTMQAYDEVLLFGPTNAKLELFNIISENPPTDNFKILVKSTAIMTDNEMHRYVKSHFKPAVLASF